MSPGHRPRVRDPRSVGLVGYGRFGRALGALFEEHGVRFRVFDPKVEGPVARAVESPSALVAEAELVVLAVPVAELDAALAALSPHLSPDTLVTDVGSVKLVPEASFRRHLGSRVPWIGTHPLFGPVSLARGERPLSVVSCPNELHPDAAPVIRAFYERLGCELIEVGADEHDRVMAETHAMAFFVAKGLIDMGAGAGAPFSPPSFRAMEKTLEAVRSDAGHLFETIERANPHAAEARRRLLGILQEADRALGQPAKETQAGAPIVIADSGSTADDLRETRELIDEIDLEVVRLLGRRAALSLRAGKTKTLAGLDIRDPERERQLLALRRAWAQEAGLDAGMVEALFRIVLADSRRIQGE